AREIRIVLDDFKKNVTSSPIKKNINATVAERHRTCLIIKNVFGERIPLKSLFGDLIMMRARKMLFTEKVLESAVAESY
ncbi:hypothetical protein AVEN_241501-2-1, partial [Araneus ventricosus]